MARPGRLIMACYCCLILVACMSTPTTNIPVDPTKPPVPSPRPESSSIDSTAAATARPSAATPPGETGSATVVPRQTSPTAQATPAQQPHARRVLPGGVGPTTLAWSPDGTTLAGSVSRGKLDTSVYLWDTDGMPRGVLSGHTAPVPALSWSPDSSLLATGSLDGTVRFWSPTGMPLRTLTTHDQQVFGLAWSPDGATLAVASVRFPPAGGTPTRSALTLPGTVTLWGADGEQRATLGPTLVTGGKFFHLAWSRDGATLAGGAVTFALWRADGTLVASLDAIGAPAWGMALSSGGTLLATGDENGRFRLYRGDGAVLFTLNRSGSVDGLAFAPGANTLAVRERGGVSLLNVHDGQLIERAVAGRGGPQSNVAWSPDGQRLAAGFGDATVRIWDTTGTIVANLGECGAIIGTIAWSPDGRTLAAGDTERLCFWRQR